LLCVHAATHGEKVFPKGVDRYPCLIAVVCFLEPSQAFAHELKGDSPPPVVQETVKLDPLTQQVRGEIEIVGDQAARTVVGLG
jgi:hypothetical protein